MQLSWLAPFTTEGYPIIKYIVYTTNTTTNHTSHTDIYPTGDRETHTISDTPSDCHTLQFEVLAENAAGKSAAGVISGGFPIGWYICCALSHDTYLMFFSSITAVSEFSVEVSVMYNVHPQATITFHVYKLFI